MTDTDKLLKRLDGLLDRVEKMLPDQFEISTEPGYCAYRWSASGLDGISQYDQVDKSELLHLERQQNLLLRNTAQFLDNKDANNALLWGARGTGKSSLIKAQLNEFKDRGLCIVEIPKAATGELFDVIRHLASDGRKFIIYLDDLSFEANDDSYKALKACLEGSLQLQPDNVIIYATSNRRHLMPESMQDNLDSTMVDGQLHPSDSIEEKISLSDRFGLWLSFHPFTQEQYLAVVEQTLKARDLKMTEDARAEALRFATQRGSRSGRIAVQFVAYWQSLK
ncbi:MAG: ATP-binding protein [Gammaproteobacteria bacterium]|nr:ATP-binding protein [Gammaproteobacteria bacterium]MDH3857459.1 ATP-binding protein [Gammaproteobacteria bacterium]